MILGRLICRLAGHQPPVYKRPEARNLHEYVRQVRVGPDKAGGREQLELYSVCPRCSREFRLGRVVTLPSLIDELTARGRAQGRRLVEEDANERVLAAQHEAESWKCRARDVGEDLDGALVTLGKLYTGCGPGHELWRPWDTRYVEHALRAPGVADHLAEAFKRVTRGPQPIPEKVRGYNAAVHVDSTLTPDQVAAEIQEAERFLRPVCQAVQHSDQVRCEPCGLVWDAGDPFPPECGRHEENKS